MNELIELIEGSHDSIIINVHEVNDNSLLIRFNPETDYEIEVELTIEDLFDKLVSETKSEDE